MSKLVAWFKSKNLFAHATAVYIVTLAGIITLDTNFQDTLRTVFKNHTDAVVLIISLAGIIFRYSKSSTYLSTVEQANEITQNLCRPASSLVPNIKSTTENK